MTLEMTIDFKDTHTHTHTHTQENRHRHSRHYACKEHYTLVKFMSKMWKKIP